MVGEDVVVEDLAELVVGDGGERAVMWVGSGVADKDVDWPELAAGLIDHVLERVFRREAGGDGDGGARSMVVVDRFGDGFATVLVARGDADPGAMRGEPLRDGEADAARRAGDDGDLAGEVEEFVHAVTSAYLPNSLRAMARLWTSSGPSAKRSVRMPAQDAASGVS